MSDRTRRTARWIVVVAIVATAALGCSARPRVAVFLQAAAAVPTADLEILRNYASQRCSVVAGCDISTQGDLMLAQRLTGSYVGNSITVEGMRRLAAALNVDHVVILRIVQWDSQISYRPERSLVLLGATSFLDTTLQILVSPLGLLFGIDKTATVGLFVSVFSPAGDVEFTTSVTREDRPLFSLLTADPVEAAKEAIDAALYQVAVAL
ncbi:MAG: hypothetical protein PHX77_07790 [Candidatus Bipolaricaulis sp.]|nr:hypothetical protein [Candidatus Bipolaricaulis sp.]